MSCYKPIRAYRCRGGGLSFKANSPLVYTDREVMLPCGQCIGCRLEKSRQWAMRCMHEASLHDESCFITLTYDEEHLPNGGVLVKRQFQLFMKRLRKAIGKVRYFMCGEYGNEYMRPHYHACLFGYQFTDLTEVRTRTGTVYTSHLLSQLWPYGFNVVGDVTFDSAAYVARYCMKKVTGEAAQDHYGYHYGWNAEGEYVARPCQPEFAAMSRRPGIGHDWVKKWRKDTYPSDTVIVNGVPCKPPRYYDNISDVDFGQRFEYNSRNGLKIRKKVSSLEMRKVKGKRQMKFLSKRENNTPDRLAVREKCAKARLQLKGSVL